MALSDALQNYTPRHVTLTGSDAVYLRNELEQLRRIVGLLVQVVKQIDTTTLVTTVASLPAAASYKGARYMVTNANATTFNSVVAAGGANIVPVFSDGTNWRIG